MVSIRGRILRLIVSMQNINPIAHPDAMEKMKKMSEKYLKIKQSKGYLIESRISNNGTTYHVIKKETCKNIKKIIYYLHGGCYICGLTNNYHAFLREFCDWEDGIAVVLLDYKTAPEYQYPTQLNEAVDLWEELTRIQGYSAENIVIGGDSSGGNLALSMMLKIRDDGGEMPAGAFLLSPWTDMTMSGESYIQNYAKDVEIGEKKSVLTKEKREKLMKSDLYSFIGNANRLEPYISPCFGSYEGFPPMFFAVGEDEMLLDDTLMVVKKLKNAKVSVSCEKKQGMFHTYVLYKNMMPESKKSFDKTKKYVQKIFEI